MVISGSLSKLKAVFRVKPFKMAARTSGAAKHSEPEKNQLPDQIDASSGRRLIGVGSEPERVAERAPLPAPHRR